MNLSLMDMKQLENMFEKMNKRLNDLEEMIPKKKLRKTEITKLLMLEKLFKKTNVKELINRLEKGEETQEDMQFLNSLDFLQIENIKK